MTLDELRADYLLTIWLMWQPAWYWGLSTEATGSDGDYRQWAT